jgi:hypothetical protein
MLLKRLESKVELVYTVGTRYITIQKHFGKTVINFI